MHQLTSFWTAPPTRIRVYPCPECHETISVNAPTCRFCSVPIDVKMAEQLWIENQQITTAITRANTFSFTTHIAMLDIGIALWFLYMEASLAEILVVSPLLALSYGAQWLNHNSSLAIDDTDYLAAVTKVKRTMRIWAAVLLVQVAAYLLLNGLPDWNTILELFVVE